MAQMVEDIMTLDLRTVELGDTIADAAKTMREGNIGNVIVTDGGRVAGIVTDRDIVIRAIAENLPPKTTPLSAITSHELLMIEQTATVDEAVHAMRERSVRRLLVCDADRKVVGIISLSDIALAPATAA
jgi:CBS domain-containing protein